MKADNILPFKHVLPILTIEQEVLFRELLALDFGADNAKAFCINASENTLKNAATIVRAYFGLLVRMQDLIEGSKEAVDESESSETELKIDLSESDIDIHLDDSECIESDCTPMSYPEFEIVRWMVISTIESMSIRPDDDLCSKIVWTDAWLDDDTGKLARAVVAKDSSGFYSGIEISNCDPSFPTPACYSLEKAKEVARRKLKEWARG